MSAEPADTNITRVTTALANTQSLEVPKTPEQVIAATKQRLAEFRNMFPPEIPDDIKPVAIELEELVEIIDGYGSKPGQEFPINTKYSGRNDTFSDSDQGGELFRLSTMTEIEDTLISSHEIPKYKNGIKPEAFVRLVWNTLQDSTYQRAIEIQQGQAILKPTMDMLGRFLGEI